MCYNLFKLDLTGPHDEMYASSLHGTVYPVDKNSARAPNCVSCHMTKGTHNISFGIVYDSWGNPVDKDGKPLSKVEQEGILPRGAVLGRNQPYQESSRIEALYYRMVQFQNVYTWKGAYHFSADFSHWYEWAYLQMSLIEIKEEARKLREMRKIRK